MSNTSSTSGTAPGSGSRPQTSRDLSKGTPDSGSQVSGAVQNAAGAAKEQVAGVAESAKNLASQAGEKLISSVEEQKVAGADFVSGMAGAIRRAANEFAEVPQAQQHIRLAADQIDRVSHAFRERDLNRLVADVQGFARRQPTAFLGASVLAGFAIVRFLKTSTEASAGSSSRVHSTHTGDSRSVSGYHWGSSSGNLPPQGGM
jgi:hypothetical protein